MLIPVSAGEEEGVGSSGMCRQGVGSLVMEEVPGGERSEEMVSTIMWLEGVRCVLQIQSFLVSLTVYHSLCVG